MKTYLKDVVEWIAQKLVVMASARALELITDAEAREQAPKALAAPRLPEIELH